jgi:hypothetical protein
MKLLELSQEYALLLEEIESCGGELSPEQEKRLETVSRELAKSADKADYVLKKLDVESDFYAARIKELQAYKKALDNASERFKSQIKAFMRESDQKRLEGEYVDLVLKTTKPKIVITDESKIPEKYVEKIITTAVNKNDIYKDMQNGALVEGVSIEENFALTTTRSKK